MHGVFLKHASCTILYLYSTVYSRVREHVPVLIKTLHMVHSQFQVEVKQGRQENSTSTNSQDPFGTYIAHPKQAVLDVRTYLRNSIPDQ